MIKRNLANALSLYLIRLRLLHLFRVEKIVNAAGGRYGRLHHRHTAGDRFKRPREELCIEDKGHQVTDTESTVDNKDASYNAYGDVGKIVYYGDYRLYYAGG